MWAVKSVDYGLLFSFRGKVQIGGIGTAFKVLSSQQSLHRQELVFFINALNRLSESVAMLQFFEHTLQLNKQFIVGMEKDEL